MINNTFTAPHTGMCGVSGMVQGKCFESFFQEKSRHARITELKNPDSATCFLLDGQVIFNGVNAKFGAFEEVYSEDALIF